MWTNTESTQRIRLVLSFGRLRAAVGTGSGATTLHARSDAGENVARSGGVSEGKPSEVVRESNAQWRARLTPDLLALQPDGD